MATGLRVVTVDPLDMAVDDYLAACRARNLAPGTIEQAYGFPLRHVLMPWLRENGITDLAELQQADLDRLNQHLLKAGSKKGGPLAAASVQSYMRSINAFLTHWHGRRPGSRPADGEPRAQLPKTERRLKAVLSREEIDRLEAVAEVERDKLIVRVLADTGMRVAELCKLRTSDLLVEGREYFLHVRGKGRKDRKVPFPSAFRRLQRLVKDRPVSAYTDRLFVGRRKETDGTYRPLTPSGVRRLMVVLMVRAGLEKRVYPHLLRHSFITWMLSKGVSPVVIARIVGHEGLEMINRVYEHLSASDSYAAMLRAFSQED